MERMKSHTWKRERKKKEGEGGDRRMSLKKKQMELEEEANRIQFNKVKDSMENTSASNTPAGVLLLKKTFNTLLKEYNKLKDTKGTKAIRAWRRINKYLTLEQQLYIGMKTVLDMVGDYPTSFSVRKKIATHLKAEVEYIRFKREAPALLYTVESNIRSDSSVHRHRVIQRAKKQVGKIEDAEVAYISIAYTLLLFLDKMGFIELYNYNKGRKRIQEVRPKEDLLAFLDDINARVASMNTYDLPMLLPPVEWDVSSFYSGGYIQNTVKESHCFIKNRDRDLKDYVQKDVKRIMNIVNCIQKTPYVINHKVLDTLSFLTSREDNLDGVLPTFQMSELPPKPWEVEGEEYLVFKEKNPSAIKDWKSRVRDMHTADVRMQTKRLLLSNQLFVANKMKEYDKIYFPHSIDYRGRVYPLPKFINPQGDDVSRGLLKFFRGEEHGERGLYWFKVYGANLFGKDKVSFNDRVKWTNKNWDKIVASGKKPKEDTWWSKADKPFQFLAFCIECSEMKSKEDTSYISHLPVQMDGSCNGLQHFSAMLRDEEGGEAVNLVDSPVPSDVYARVARQTTAIIKQYPEKRFWWDKIDRSVVKRCVMTTPYGVTEYGMKDQLMEYFQKQKDKGMVLPEVMHKECIFLARQIQKAIKKVLRGSIEIKEWLQEQAMLFEEGMIWHSPVGFKVINNPKKYKIKHVRVHFMSSLKLHIPGDDGVVNKRRMKNTVSPNFVHSMDAAHMGMTVEGLWKEGIRDISMIHDSFGCHSCNVEIMHRIIREQFVEMYQTDWLEKIRKKAEKEIGEEVEKVEKGTLNIDDVLKSKYFFS